MKHYSLTHYLFENTGKDKFTFAFSLAFPFKKRYQPYDINYVFFGIGAKIQDDANSFGLRKKSIKMVNL